MRTRCLLIILTLSLLPLAADAAPVGSRLLAMVPEDAQIVSGLKLPHGEARAQLSLATHNNNVDFNDWLALVSVDPQVSGRELVEVAASSPRGELEERLLLVDGTFDAEHIYRAAVSGGASAAEFAGVHVIVVPPFAREKDVRVGVRWLAIPNDRTALFGTPLLVQKALNRRAVHAQPIALFTTHLQDLRPGADEWSILAMPNDELTRHMGNAYFSAQSILPLAPWDELVMSFRWRRSSIGIDFAGHPEGDFSETTMALNARTELNATKLNRASRIHFERIAVKGRRVEGTLTVTETAPDVPREIAIR